jgi:hypothetical protein
MEFGIFAGNTKASSVQDLESAVGRSFAYIRVYRSWDDTFPETNVSTMNPIRRTPSEVGRPPSSSRPTARS